MKMESAVLSVSNNNNTFRTHLKNAASAICARTLPKQRRSEPQAASSARHHTYPRTTPPKRASLTCRMEPLACIPNPTHNTTTYGTPEPLQSEVSDVPEPTKLNGSIKLTGTLAREVANAWSSRVGQPDQPASADRIQSLFNDIELYPTKTQVFEMLVCARQCARRKSLVLTFGEFCVFAAELRRCSRQARQTSNKPESPVWNVDRELRDKEAICKHVNGSEPSPPPCEVFLGGSCNPTTWRSDIAIPMLKNMGITYFNPQVEDWSTELMEVEHRAKAAARALLFVLDSETRAVAASVEAAHLAAAPRDLLLVLRPYARHQTIGNETISDHEYVELSRARATLQEAVERRGLPAFSDIPSALRCARAVVRGARTQPRQPLGHTILRLKRAYDKAGGRSARLPRARAIDALADLARAPRARADRCLPPGEAVDFETFCAAVAELAADSECGSRNGPQEAAEGGEARVSAASVRDNGLHMYNARLRAYGRKLGLFIPKNGGNRMCASESGGAASGAGAGTGTGSPDSGEAVFTPGTERRLERLPAMLGAPTHDVYLAGSFPAGSRAEEQLRGAGLSCVRPRANDYTRMFSAPARRAAPAHPESPRHDKKPRPAGDAPTRGPDCHVDGGPHEDVTLRDPAERPDRTDRLSASDFYTVSEEHTPLPFKGTYDEDLVLGSRVLVFSLSADSPCFSAMVLAAHYMGLRPAATVLIVQPMDYHKAHAYSEAAVKDYNRGRHYLADLARRSGVPVFESVDAAVACVLGRLRANASPTLSHAHAH